MSAFKNGTVLEEKSFEKVKSIKRRTEADNKSVIQIFKTLNLSVTKKCLKKNFIEANRRILQKCKYNVFFFSTYEYV